MQWNLTDIIPRNYLWVNEGLICTQLLTKCMAHFNWWLGCRNHSPLHIFALHKNQKRYQVTWLFTTVANVISNFQILSSFMMQQFVYDCKRMLPYNVMALLALSSKDIWFQTITWVKVYGSQWNCTTRFNTTKGRLWLILG